MVVWLTECSGSDPEVEYASRNIPADEQSLVPELVRLTRTRHQMLRREQRQGRYRKVLQGLRVLHVPFSLLFLLLLPLHVLWALDVPAKALPLGSVLGSTLGGYHPAGNCSRWHERIVKDRRTSMQAH